MLFKTIEEFGVADVNTDISRLQPYIIDAEGQYIQKILGLELLEDLQEKYDADPSPALSDEYAALLDKIQDALRNLSMYKALPKLNIRVNDLGVVKSESADFSPASGGDIYFARTQYLIDGYSSLDTLIAFLELHKADYPLWTASDEYAQYKKYWINTTEEFSKHVSAVSNRWLFSRILPQIDTVEKLRIKGAIGTEFFQDLKEKFVAGDLSSEELALLFGDDDNTITGLVKPIALFAFADCLTDPTIRELLRIVNAASADDITNKGKDAVDYTQQYFELAEAKREEAQSFMTQIIKYLNDTATDSVYPLYFASDLYKDPDKTVDTSINNYNNDTSSSSFALM